VQVAQDSFRAGVAVTRTALAPVLAALTIAIALDDLVLGWGAGIDLFVRLRPGLPGVVPVSALCILVAGFGVLASQRTRSPTLPLASAGLLALIVSATWLSRLGPELLPGRDRMSVATTIGPLLIAASLALRTLPNDRGVPAAISVESLGLVLVTIPLIGYAYDAHALFGIPAYTSLALQTTLSLLFLFLAQLFRQPFRGWVAILFAPAYGSRVLRQILPVVILGPLLLTGLALWASLQGYGTPALRAAILTFLMILCTGSAAVFFAGLANRSEDRSADIRAALDKAEHAELAARLALAQSQKAEAMGKLVGGVAHDFNNTLTVILGNLELLADEPSPDLRAEYLREATAASTHASDLTRQLLAYGRRSRLDPQPSRLDDLVEPALAMFRRVCAANIAITTDLNAASGTVRLDAANFRQALVNLLINARDAQPAGGAIHVSTRTTHLSRELVAGLNEVEPLPDGRYVVVTVRDRGPGMTPEVMARATEPFFTTKGVGEGSGLGLSVVAGFCTQSGGVLMFDTAGGQGLSVSMAFPLAPVARPVVAPPPDAADPRLPQPRTILVVDDEAPVTRIIARQLRMDGHQVRIAMNAEQALLILEAEPLPDLILTDLVMPGVMQGHGLSETVSRLYPSVRVLLMSGYESAGLRQAMSIGPEVRFLQKPIDRATLRTAVAEAFAS
jgi:signal transduction histidine kinase/CheY-like chemotaxis protein